MDKQEYLNQISAKPAPKQKSFSNILTNKFLWIGVGVVILLIIIMGIGNALSQGKTTPKDRLMTLMVHIDNLSGTIGEYQDSVKSSSLRANSASLSSVLANTATGLNNYAIAQFNYKKSKVPKTIQAAEAKSSEELNHDLFIAKINGNLDNVYALKMATEISIIITSEKQILSEVKSENLANILNPSIDSLNNLYPSFDDYDMTK